MTYLLQHTDPYGRPPTFFVRLGLQWPHHPERRLIDAVTADRSEARAFATEEEARETLAKAGSPPGWDAVEA